MKIALAGAGAFGQKHLDGLSRIDDADVISLVSQPLEEAQRIAEKYGIPHVTRELQEAISKPEVDAVILCTPTPMHAEQAIMCMDAGKHVEVEIPVSDSWADARAVEAKQIETGLVCAVGHTRRFNPSHQWIKQKIQTGELNIQQMDIQTFFFRRENMNAAGNPRTWTDHLLWHHAAHSVDLFRYQTGEEIVVANAIQGPEHPKLGISMDMSIQLKTTSGKVCSLSLSFNNDGPFGTFFRYICDNGTYIARYDDLVTGHDEPIDVSDVAVSFDGIELQDREFLESIQNGREPVSSLKNVLPCYKTLHDLQEQMNTHPETVVTQA